MSTKQVQGKLWSIAPNYWSTHFEPFFIPMYKEALSQIRLDENSLLLDAGCGAGLFSHMALTAGAQVVGVDAAPGLLEVARRRNPGTNFLEEDLEVLPFASENFDVVAGFNSFQYAGNFSGALSEAKRVLKKGGRLVIGMWDKPQFSDATNILKAMVTLLPPPLPGSSSPFALSEDGRMEQEFESIGLSLIYKTKVACPFFYHSAGDAMKSFLGTAPAAAALNDKSENTVRQTIGKALQPYRLTEDMHHLQNSFLVFIAEK